MFSGSFEFFKVVTLGFSKISFVDRVPNKPHPLAKRLNNRLGMLSGVFGVSLKPFEGLISEKDLERHDRAQYRVTKILCQVQS